MVKSVLTAAVATAAMAFTFLSPVSDASMVHKSGSISNAHYLLPRQSTSILQKDYSNGAAPPGARPGDAPGQTVIVNSNGGHDDNSQRQGCESIFIGTAQVGGSSAGGWSNFPQVLGFDTFRDLSVGGGVQPYIMETGKELSKVKRVLIVQPGLPRDFWKYSNLVRNSLLCSSLNKTSHIDLSEILIAAPAWLNSDDKNAGAAQENDIVFKGQEWSTGSPSVGPGNTAVSAFDVLDLMTQKFFDRSKFPAVNQVFIVGHSAGGSLTQHYAMLRKNSTDDVNTNFFVGNPGAYVWPVTERPVTPSDTSCANKVDDWAYGLTNVVPYGRDEVKSGRETVARRYYSRNIVYGLGLADKELGDSHCEAQYQGSSHLTRGQNFQKVLDSLPGGAPKSQIFNYVANVAHEDYLIFSDPVSQHYLFANKLNTRDSTSSSSSSNGPSSNGSPSSSSGSNGSNGSGSKSSGTSRNGADSLGSALLFGAVMAVGLLL